MAAIEMFFSLHSDELDSVTEVRAFIDQQPEAGLRRPKDVRRGLQQYFSTRRQPAA